MAGDEANSSAPAPLIILPKRAERIPHPYLGYVMKPGWDPYGRAISDFGLTDEVYPIQKKTSDRLIVGIFGGSVARDGAPLGI